MLSKNSEIQETIRINKLHNLMITFIGRPRTLEINVHVHVPPLTSSDIAFGSPIRGDRNSRQERFANSLFDRPLNKNFVVCPFHCRDTRRSGCPTELVFAQKTTTYFGIRLTR